MNEQNLKPAWKPGQSGNPKGKPKGAFSFASRLKKYLKVKVEVEGVKMTALDATLVALIAQAKAGNIAAIKEIADRTDGKVAQAVELMGKDGMPLTPPTIVINEAIAGQGKDAE